MTCSWPLPSLSAKKNQNLNLYSYFTRYLAALLKKVVKLQLSQSGSEPFPKRQILDSSKLKDFADDNFNLDENGRKFSKRVENTVFS